MPSWPIEMPSETAMVTNSMREAARVAHAVLRPLGEPVERHVARRDLVPARRHADLRLAPVGVGHADRAQHRPGGRTLHAVGDLVAARLHGLRHAGQRTWAVSAIPLRFRPMTSTASEVSNTEGADVGADPGAGLGIGAMGSGVLPRTFAWSGKAQGDRMRWFAAGLRAAMLDQG